MTATLKTSEQPDGKIAGIESSAGFGSFIVNGGASRDAVGHIWCEKIDRTLCNVEARVKPWTNTETDHFFEEFEPWRKTNWQWICKRCAAAFEALPNAAVSNAVNGSNTQTGTSNGVAL